MGNIKTNAVRILDKNKIKYEVTTYDAKDGKIDGAAVAEKIGKAPERVFKTLVTQGHSKEFYVFMIPVLEELDLKKASKVVCEKKLEMIHVKDILKVTGYIRGGCSPIGMKKQYKTVADIKALEYDTITFSAGKIGVQITMNSNDLKNIIDINFKDIVVSNK